MPTTLLGGILRCGQCGGSVVKVNARACGRAVHNDRGPTVCGGVAANHADVDRVVLDYVRGALGAPDVLACIEREAPRRAAQLARASDQVDPLLPVGLEVSGLSRCSRCPTTGHSRHHD